MVGYPSVDVHVSPEGGNVVQTVHLQSAYSPEIDLTRLRQLAAQWYASLQRLSEGPLQPRDLRVMGHPYGFGATPTVSWARLSDPRRIPGYQGVYRAGARGFVSNRAVINSVSGQFRASWRYSLTLGPAGVQLNFWNEARSDRGANYPWYLFYGTIRMQAHGPWEEVARQLLPEVQTAWRTGAQEAARRQRAMTDQFGEEAVAAQDAQFEEGGFR